MRLSRRTSTLWRIKTKVALRKIYFRLENARRLIELYETTLIPQAAAAIEVAETWHQEGPKSITGFLETQSVWLNFNLARLRAIADYQQNVAQLEQLVGGRSMIHILCSKGKLRYLFTRVALLFKCFRRNFASNILCRRLFRYWKHPATLSMGFIMLTVWVGGCASHRLETYQELRGTELQQPAYYHTEIEKKIASTESEPIVESDPVSQRD